MIKINKIKEKIWKDDGDEQGGSRRGGHEERMMENGKQNEKKVSEWMKRTPRWKGIREKYTSAMMIETYFIQFSSFDYIKHKSYPKNIPDWPWGKQHAI